MYSSFPTSDTSARTSLTALWRQRWNFSTERGQTHLNAIVTESKAASKVIKRFVKLFDLLLVTVAYLALATWISPQLTAFAIFIIGGVGLGLRHLIGSGYDLGDRVAAANERMQQVVQAGMIGIRDIRVFISRRHLP